MSHPNTILMDEPSMGLSPKLVKEIFAIIRKLHDQALPYCWSNRTRIWPCRSPIVRMCSKPGASPWKATPRS